MFKKSTENTVIERKKKRVERRKHILIFQMKSTKYIKEQQ